VRSLDAGPRQEATAALLPELARRVSPGAVVLAAALPILFLHVQYQPSTALPLGGQFKLQDAAVLAVAVAALAEIRRSGLTRLRAGLPIWVAAAAFCVWVVAATFYPLARSTPYAWRTHLVTAGEFVEYALLAPAVPLLVRRRADVWLVLGALAAWGAAATIAGLLQFAGLRILQAWPAGHRQPSFVGTHDFGALSGMAVGVGMVGLLWRVGAHRSRLALWAALAFGLVGFFLDGSAAGIAGIVPAALVAGALAARRRLVSSRLIALALAAIVAASVGVVALRAKDFNQFLRFTGLRSATASTSRNVQTYSQRTVLAYIGVKIWLGHPLIGAGWQSTKEPATVGPVLPAAHRRFPDVAPQSFPSPQHEYGVQMLYVETLADLGLVGGALLLGMLLTPLVLGVRTALRAPASTAGAAVLGVFWLVLSLGLFLAIGLVAGLPTDALLWLAIGTTAAATAAAERARGTVPA
jgi:O-Antigen ligase